MSLENEGTDNPPRSATISSSLTKKRKIRGGFRAHSTKLSRDAKVLLLQNEPDILKTEHLSLSSKEKVKLCNISMMKYSILLATMMWKLK